MIYFQSAYELLRRGQIRLLAVIIAFAAFCVSCVNDRQGGSLLNVGDSMPEFSVTLNDGTTVSNNFLRGKVSVIVFFDTGCGDCQRELPHLQQAYDLLCATGDEVTFVCVARSEDRAAVEGYWNECAFTMPWSAPGTRSVYNKFAADGVPRTYVFDKAGHLAMQYGPETEISATALVSAVRALVDKE